MSNVDPQSILSRETANDASLLARYVAEPVQSNAAEVAR
jgi:hypothetical protein